MYLSSPAVMVDNLTVHICWYLELILHSLIILAHVYVLTFFFSPIWPTQLTCPQPNSNTTAICIQPTVPELVFWMCIVCKKSMTIADGHTQCRYLSEYKTGKVGYHTYRVFSSDEFYHNRYTLIMSTLPPLIGDAKYIETIRFDILEKSIDTHRYLLDNGEKKCIRFFYE